MGSPHRDHASDGAPTRRRVLAATGALAAGAGVAPGVAAGQDGNRYTLRMVVPSAREFRGNYEGQFVIVSDQLSRRVDRAAIEGCSFANWSPDDTRVYEVVLIDRLRKQNPPSVRALGYVNADEASDVELGDTFIVTRRADCPDEYVGLELERLQPRRVGTFEQTSVSTETNAVGGDGGGGGGGSTDGAGPGLGAAAGVAGIALWAFRRAVRR